MSGSYIEGSVQRPYNLVGSYVGICIDMSAMLDDLFDQSGGLPHLPSISRAM